MHVARRVFASGLFLLLVAAAAAAQSQRTFVASTGLDTNPCSRTSPCRNFTAAVAAVQDGGEVVVLDSAGYGPVTINKSVSIVAPAGVYAGVTAFTNDAITIYAPTGTVMLRGLTLNGLGAIYGVHLEDAAKVYIEDCVISAFGSTGVAGSPSSTYPVLIIDGVESRDNYYGFYIAATPISGVMGEIGHSRAVNNQSHGFFFTSSGLPSSFVVHDSSASFNNAGLYANGAFEVDVRRVVATQNTYAVRADSGATVSVCTSMITMNAYAFYNSGSQIASCGDNQVKGNGNPNFGTVSALAMQ